MPSIGPTAAGVVFDFAGNMFVVDTGRDRILRYDSGDLTTVETEITGDTLKSPVDIAVDANDVIYVANSGNNTITSFANDGTGETEFLASLLNEPMGLAFQDPTDDRSALMIANVGNRTVVQCDFDGGNPVEITDFAAT